MKQSRGISILEVALAVSLGLMLTAGSVYAYRQHMQSTRVIQAKMMLATMRQGIEMQRYRTGAFPSAASLSANVDDVGKAFYGLAGAPLRDPLFPPMDAAASSPIIDLTIDATGSPWGGWGYDSGTGQIEPNLDPSAFPGDPPGAW